MNLDKGIFTDGEDNKEKSVKRIRNLGAMIAHASV
jgi:hypothetical protein